MADKNNVHYLPNNKEGPPRSTRKHRRESSGAEEGPSAKQSPNCLPALIKEVIALWKKLSKQLMGHSLMESLSLQVVNSALQLQWEHLWEKSKNGGKAKMPSIRGSVCNLFSLSTHSHSKIIQSFFEGNVKGHKSRPRGDCDSGICCAHNAKAMEHLV